MERKAKSFDKTITEMKGKVDRLSFDLDVSQKDTRNASSELFKVKSAYEETILQLEDEKMELQSALEEAEATLEQEENKVLRCQMELTQVKVEIDRRIAEK